MNVSYLQVRVGIGHSSSQTGMHSESHSLIYEQIENLVSDYPKTADDHDNWIEVNGDQTELAEMILKVADQPEHPEWISIIASCLDSLGMIFCIFIRRDESEQHRFNVERFDPFIPCTEKTFESACELVSCGEEVEHVA